MIYFGGRSPIGREVCLHASNKQSYTQPRNDGLEKLYKFHLLTKHGPWKIFTNMLHQSFYVQGDILREHNLYFKKHLF